VNSTKIWEEGKVAMVLAPRSLRQYHVFLASPGDVGAERQYVRKFFDEYNRDTAQIWNVRFDVIDWEKYGTIDVGRPQELIARQTLEKYRDSLALVVGIMGERFGTPSGKAESGTECPRYETASRVPSYLPAGGPRDGHLRRSLEIRPRTVETGPFADRPCSCPHRGDGDRVP
jgi:hypothetical protein